MKLEERRPGRMKGRREGRRGGKEKETAWGDAEYFELLKNSNKLKENKRYIIENGGLRGKRRK